ncbi:MAG: M6 family metalloprotease domain-containing protein [Thermoanaerobaculum sp.]
MKRPWIALLLGLAWVSAGWSVVVNPQRETVVQPDGSILGLVPVGDEFNFWWELPSGETVIQDREGFFCLAVRDEHGRLQPGPRVGSGGQISAQGLMPKHLRPTVRGWGAGEFLPPLPYSRPAGIRQLAGAEQQPVLVILVSFTDRPPVGSQPGDFAQLFFTGGLSAAAYFSQTSLGKLSLTPAAETHGTVQDGVVGWLSLSMPHPNRGITGSKDPAITEQQKKEASHNMRLAVKAAIEAADPYVDFSRFDTDGNGGLSRAELSLVIITAGYESSYGGYKATYSPANWGHRWSLGNFNDGIGPVPAPVVDGVRVADYAFDGGYTSFGEWMQSNASNGHRSTIGVMVHELGHDVLGLPDLYDTDGSSAGVGGLCLMGTGSWGCEPPCYGGELPVLLSAWSRVVTEIVSPRDALGSDLVRVFPAVSGGDVVRLGTGVGNEYFLLEQRRAQAFDRGLLRWDLAFEAHRGLAIWHVDESQTSNADEARRLVDLEEANGGEPLNSKDNTFAVDMLFRPGFSSRFADDSVPSSRRQTDGESTGVTVEAWAWEGDALVTQVEAPNPVGVLHDRCQEALEVTLAPGETYRWQGWLAQATGGDVQASCAPFSKTAFWQITPRQTGKLSIRAEGFDTVVQVFQGSCNRLLPMACNDDVDQTGASELRDIPARRGESYLLAVGRYGSGRPVGGELALTVSLGPVDPLVVEILETRGCPFMALKVSVKNPDGIYGIKLQPENFRVYFGDQESAIRRFAMEDPETYWLVVLAPPEGRVRVEVDTCDRLGQAEATFSCQRVPRRVLNAARR